MKKEFHFDIPELILILTENKRDDYLEKIFQTGLDQIKKPYTALSLNVERRYLKNMLTAVKLMDIRGIFIPPGYRKYLKRFTDDFETGAFANAVVLKKKKYMGYNTLSSAYRSQIKALKQINRSKISVFGCGDYLDSLVAELERKRPKELNILKGARLTKGALSGSDITIICGPSDFKIPSQLTKGLEKGSCLIDMREGLQKYPKTLASLGRKLTKNHVFLTHLVAETIRLWTNKIIDIETLGRPLRQICVK